MPSVAGRASAGGVWAARARGVAASSGVCAREPPYRLTRRCQASPPPTTLRMMPHDPRLDPHLYPTNKFMSIQINCTFSVNINLFLLFFRSLQESNLRPRLYY